MLSTQDSFAEKTLNILHTGRCHNLSYKLSALLLYTKKQDAFPQKTRIKRTPSVSQSISTLSRDRPDVIVLEFEHSNQQELDALRKLRRSAGSLPIVVISAAAEHPKYGHQAIYNGANDFFPIQSLSWSIFSQALSAPYQQSHSESRPMLSKCAP